MCPKSEEASHYLKKIFFFFFTNIKHVLQITDVLPFIWFSCMFIYFLKYSIHKETVLQKENMHILNDGSDLTAQLGVACKIFQNVQPILISKYLWASGKRSKPATLLTSGTQDTHYKIFLFLLNLSVFSLPILRKISVFQLLQATKLKGFYLVRSALNTLNDCHIWIKSLAYAISKPIQDRFEMI